MKPHPKAKTELPQLFGLTNKEAMGRYHTRWYKRRMEPPCLNVFHCYTCGKICEWSLNPNVLIKEREAEMYGMTYQQLTEMKLKLWKGMCNAVEVMTYGPW